MEKYKKQIKNLKQVIEGYKINFPKDIMSFNEMLEDINWFEKKIESNDPEKIRTIINNFEDEVDGLFYEKNWGKRLDEKVEKIWYDFYDKLLSIASDQLEVVRKNELIKSQIKNLNKKLNWWNNSNLLEKEIKIEQINKKIEELKNKMGRK